MYLYFYRFLSAAFVRSISATAKVKLLPHHAKHSTFATICSTASPPNSYSSMTAPISLLSRPISTNLFSLAKSDGGQRTPTDESLDAFRATEEKIEREFEAKHKEDTSSGPQSQGGENDKEEERIQQVRCRILDAALPFVQSQGWSREAISSGAEKCGYPGVVHGMFPNGGAELVHHFYMKCNSQLIEQLKSDADARPADQPAPVPTEFIANAIKLRLQMIEPYIETWPKALAVMTLPQNVPTSLAQLLTLIDDICYYAGDRSVDVSIFCGSRARQLKRIRICGEFKCAVLTYSSAGIHGASVWQPSTK